MKEAQSKDDPRRRTTRQNRFVRALLFLLPLVIVTAAILIALILVDTSPKARRTPAKASEALVYARAVERSREPVTVSAMGTVIPAREIVLRSRVSGEVIDIGEHFIDGGILRKGEEIIRLDPTDYEIAIVHARADLERADVEFKLEAGQRNVAAREWKLLGTGDAASNEERSLALREPHLARVKASREAAEAGLRQAELNLERTIVRTPFNAVIKSRDTELGAQVSIQDPLATLVGTDTYWVRVSVPVDRLAWLDLPVRDGDPASRALITAASGAFGAGVYTGRVIRLLSDLDEKGRMARLLIEVGDPLGLAVEGPPRAPLLLGSYVRVELEGVVLSDVCRISRAALRDNTKVWVAADDDTLDIRTVEVAWRGADAALVTAGLDEGDRLVVSDLAAPVQDMKLQVREDGGDAARKRKDDG